MRKQNRIRHTLTGTLTAVMTALVMILTAFLPGAFLPAQAAKIPADDTLTVNGLDPGDEAVFYQFVQWSDSGWKFTPAFQTLVDGQTENKPVLEDVKNGEITPEVAGKIASMILTANYTSAGSDTVGTGETSASLKPEEQTGRAELGIYCVIVKPGTSDTLYNPIFVSLDFKTDSDPNHNGIDVGLTGDAILAGNYSNQVTAKKVRESLTKDTKDMAQTDFALGDEIQYEIDTNIPAYTTAYPGEVNGKEGKRIFEITDTLSPTGIFTYTIDTSKISVKVDDKTVTQGTEGDYTLELNKKDDDSDVTTGWTIKFTQTFLDKQANWGKPVHVSYKVTVDKGPDWEEKNLVTFDNTAEIHFYNHPKADNKTVMKEETKHYTFGIGGKVEGNEKYHEIVKVEGENSAIVYTEPVKEIIKDEQGNEKEIIYHYKEKTSDYRGLKDAVFGIYTKPGCTDADAVKRDGKNYTCKTDEDGIFVFTGLDAGVDYYIKELDAPPDYVKKMGTVKLSFTSTYGERITSQERKKNDNLTQYVVNVTNSTENSEGDTDDLTSTVTFIKKTTKTTIDGKDVEVATYEPSGSAADHQANVGNVPGKDLPSTGGIGTGIFHLIGVLLLAAALFFAVKTIRRAKE